MEVVILEEHYIDATVAEIKKAGQYDWFCSEMRSCHQNPDDFKDDDVIMFGLDDAHHMYDLIDETEYNLLSGKRKKKTVKLPDIDINKWKDEN